MPVKTLTHPTTGQTVKLGRNRPTVEVRKLSFRDYLTATPLPAAPDCDYATEAAEALGEMYRNDELGDCVIACGGHLFGVLNENAGGNKSLFSAEEIGHEYTLIGGWDPNDPVATDNGCFVTDLLNRAVQHGFKGHRMVNGQKIKHDHHIAGWLAINGSNKEEVRQAVWLFENLEFGIELPDEWISPFPSASGFTWDVAGAADPNNGHCVLGCKTDSTGVGIATWGMVGTMTYEAVAEYTAASVGGELYTAISAEGINRAKAKAPNGFDWATLVANFKSLGGTIAA